MSLVAIRAVQANDLPQVVAIHQQAFQGFHMTLLGSRFLAGYYQTVLDYPDSIFLAAVDAEQMLGFVAGFVNPSRFYALLRARKRALALAAATHLALRPHLWRRTLSSLRRAQTLADTGDQPHLAELASIGVSPKAQGRGIGKALTLTFLDAARQKQAKEVMLTTDAHNNDAVNRFYQNLGFQCIRQFWHTPERLMNEYRIALSQVQLASEGTPYDT
jgi:ribosomal protein S18 acetylase RimI-like enzyme